jgi:hypothetical protein
VLVLPYQHGSHSGVLHRGVGVGTPVLASPALAEEVRSTGAGRVVPLAPACWAEALVAALGNDPMPPPPRPRSDERRTGAGTAAVYRETLIRRAGGKGSPER